MATSLQKRCWILGFVLLTALSHCSASSEKYELTSKIVLSDEFSFEFMPLSDDGPSRAKRQTSNSSNNRSNVKTKINFLSTQKLDKNSASDPSDTPSPSSSVKKNLSESLDKTKGEYDDELIEQFTNYSSLPTPQVLHDHHKYYNSTIVTEPTRINEFWVDLDQMEQDKVVTHDMLSKSYRRAATVTLSFDFPFYGHILRNATIATGGFLYLGDYMHSWLASTQYIAPLMANFDSSLSETSVIKYADNGTHFIVQWIETVLQDHKSAGTFTFQACLRDTGDIIFAYKDVPLPISAIPDSEHPVRVGISDAYIIDRTFILHKRKIIYEYHRVEITKEHIANLTAVYLTALPSCISFKDCESCLKSNTGFVCLWCQQAQRCSDGMDRHRHDWLIKGCDSVPKAPDDATCPILSTLSPFDDSKLVQHEYEEKSSFGAAGIIGILFVVALIVAFVAWMIYAYRYPHTPSGQIIIKYRPSQWQWLKGEADYTPASVHI